MILKLKNILHQKSDAGGKPQICDTNNKIYSKTTNEPYNHLGAVQEMSWDQPQRTVFGWFG